MTLEGERNERGLERCDVTVVGTRERGKGRGEEVPVELSESRSWHYRSDYRLHSWGNGGRVPKMHQGWVTVMKSQIVLIDRG